MDIKILGSGSSGNCYIINDGATSIMIDCGIPFQDIKIKTNFFEEKISGCLISHSHSDHIASAGKLMGMGIDCYMSGCTAFDSKLNINMDLIRSRVIVNNHGDVFDIGSFRIKALSMKHDVPCLGFLIYSNASKESLFFATDTYYIPYDIPAVEYIMVEANYDLEILNRRIQAGDTDMVAKDRLIKSHMSIEAAINWLKETNLSRCKRIYLMHLSDGSSNEEEFKRRVIEATGIPTRIC